MSAVPGAPGRRTFAFALLAALLLLLVPYRTLLGPGIPSGRDLFPYFYPLKAHFVEAVRDGEMPWIDRYRQGGLPLLASPGVAAFDPGNVLFFLLPLASAAKAWMLLRVLAGAAGFAVFLRLAGLPPLSAALGGLVWGAGGVTASAASFLSTSSAFAALPWLAAALLRARERRDARSAALLALATALTLVAGVPEPILLGGLLSLVLLARRGEGPPARERLGTAARWAASGLLGAAIAAPALGALLVTGLESIRSIPGALTAGFAEQGSLPASRLPDLVADGLVADWSRVVRAEGVPAYPYFPSLAPGHVALTLALLGLVAGRGGRLAAAALAVLGVLLALGPATPAFGLLLKAAPFGGALRYPEKLAVLWAFGAAWLAALGASALEKALGERRAPAAFGLLGLLVALDRGATTGRLLPMAEEALLERPPRVLAPIAGVDAPGTPPRLFAWTGYHVPPEAIPAGRVPAGEEMAAWAFPFTPGLWGVGTVHERDYDFSLPRAQLDWVLFLEGLPRRSPVPGLLARAAGARAVVDADPSARGPRLLPIREPVSPFRFVRRLVRAPGVREAAERFLREGAPADAAVLVGGEGEATPGAGRVVRVSDRPSRLEIEVAVEGPDPAYLLVARPVVATRDAAIDGRPVAVDDANLGFTGLAVPPGRHVVRLRPPGRWLIIAAVLSILGLATTSTLMAAAPRRGRTAP